MRFRADDGSEWETEAIGMNPSSIRIKRILEKSELEKWIEAYLSPLEVCGAKKSFVKAIEVAIDEEKNQKHYSGHRHGMIIIINKLKQFAGINEQS